MRWTVTVLKILTRERMGEGTHYAYGGPRGTPGIPGPYAEATLVSQKNPAAVGGFSGSDWTIRKATSDKCDRQGATNWGNT